MEKFIYLTIYDKGYDGYIEEFKTLNEANEEAYNYWNDLTDHDKSKTRVYVMGLRKEDYDLVYNNETIKWYGDFMINELDTFDSDFNCKHIK